MKSVYEEVRKQIDEIFKRYKERTGSLKFPIDEDVLISIIEELKGVKIEVERVKGKTFVGLNEGILIPKEGGFLIKYGVNPYKSNKEIIISPVARKRFTICHELAHILSYDSTYRVPKPLMIFNEHFYNEIARQLLLPEEVLRQKFQEYEHKEPKPTLIQFLRDLANEAKVSIYPLVKRVVEDLGLLERVMITFWYVEDYDKNEIRVDSKVSNDLRNILTRYWRRRICERVWNEGIKNIKKGVKTPLILPQISIENKRKRGKIKKISFNVECDFYHKQLLLFKGRFISIEKFDEIEFYH
jgi:Zn-dependent peptidase ImmA (M78 family)